jgi:hypothetical protein
MKPATPADAKAAWESMPRPSTRKVSEKLKAAGLSASNKTVNLWRKAGWTSNAQPPAEKAKDALDAAAPAVTGDPSSKAEDVPKIIDGPDKDTSTVELFEEGSRDTVTTARNLLAYIRAQGPMALAVPEATGKLLAACIGSIEQARVTYLNTAPLREREMKVVNGAVAPPTIEQKIEAHPLRASLLAYGKALGETTQ